MKALLLRQHGGLENLEVVTDHPLPQATEGHVVIRVRARVLLERFFPPAPFGKIGPAVGLP